MSRRQDSYFLLRLKCLVLAPLEVVFVARFDLRQFEFAVLSGIALGLIDNR